MGLKQSALYHGLLQSSEALNLRVEDFISIDDKQIFLLRKNQSTGARECPESLMYIISTYLETTALAEKKTTYLFPSSHGVSGILYPYKQYRGNSLWRMLKTRGAGVGLRNEVLSPAAIRSAGITNLLSKTDNLNLVRERAGHSDVHTTAYYIPKN